MIEHMLFTLNKRESAKNNNREKQKRRENKIATMLKKKNTKFIRRVHLHICGKRKCFGTALRSVLLFKLCF